MALLLKKRQETVNMTCKVLPRPPSAQQQHIYLSQILSPTSPLPTTYIPIETTKKQCDSCKQAVLSSPESLATGICLTCRQKITTHNMREEAKQKSPQPLPIANQQPIITSPYFQHKRTINQLYSDTNQKSTNQKKPKSAQSTTYICEQTCINKDHKNVCPLCQLTTRKKNQTTLCAACTKYRLNKRKSNCYNCREFLGYANKFILCLCSSSFCVVCKEKISCCSQFVNMVKKSEGEK